MTSAAKLIAASRDGILLDTNVLLVLLVGSVDEKLVGNVSRLRGYDAEDFRRLSDLVSNANRIVMTPHIAVETWNLADNMLYGSHKKSFMNAFGSLMIRSEERWTKTVEICKARHFSRLGVADTGIAIIKRRRPVVITDDSGLFRALGELGHRCINFTHLRNFSS